MNQTFWNTIFFNQKICKVELWYLKDWYLEYNGYFLSILPLISQILVLRCLKVFKPSCLVQDNEV